MRRMLSVLTLALCVAAVPLAAQTPGKKAPKPQRNSPMRISGNPSTLASCVAGEGTSVHALGWAPSGTRITVNLEGDGEFDGIATAVLVQMGPSAGDTANVRFQYSDDGDEFDPRLDFTLENDASVVVLVGSYDGSPGCYLLKVDVQ